jgi:hypothetical protein
MTQSARTAPMAILQEQQFFSELVAGHSGPTIPEAKRVYFQTRLRNRLFDYILGRFVQEQKKGLTKAILARRIGKPPELINRWLGAPSNLTLDTVSDLLLGISAEELTPQSEPLLYQAQRNWIHAAWIEEGDGATDPEIKRESKTANDAVDLPWKKAS